MKHFTIFIFVLISYQTSLAQLSRYPYIQSTTKNSTIIAWKTDPSTTGQVNYGTDINNLNQSVSETSPTSLHGITLENLSPDTKYYYEILANGNVLTSEFFWTASDSTDQQFSFLHYGDCGYNSAMQHQIGDLMEADDANFAVVCGDIDQGGVPHVTASEGGDNYDEIYFDVYNDGVNSKMLSHECHYTAIGNHDTYKDNGQTYENEFFLPHNNAENSERYYSFEWGDAKFIALDVITPYDHDDVFPPYNDSPNSERWWTDFTPGSAQYQFLEDELKCNDKKWLFVYFHEGPWTNYWGADYNLPLATGGDYYQYEGNLMVREHLVPLFETYGVDIVMVGHSHLYERAEKNGVMYITSGSAGDSDVSANIEYANHPEITTAILDNVYVKYSIDNDNISFNVINKDNNVIDTYNNTKSYTPFAAIGAPTNASCAAAEDGIAVLNVTGPKPPYTIEWFDGTTGSVLSDVAPGTYYAIVTNTYGCEKVASVTVGDDMEMPNAEFTFNNTDNVYDFIGADASGDTYLWDFGNGDTETTTSNINSYTYTENGTYTVTLTVTTACGTDVYMTMITVDAVPNSIGNLNQDAASISISPNPVSDIATVNVSQLSGKLFVSIFDVSGKEIQSFRTRNKEFTIQNDNWTSGKYFVKVTDKKGKFAVTEMIVR